MTFREAKAEDLAQIAALYAGAIGTEGCTWSENYPTEEDIHADFQAGGLYVLEDGGRVIGAASVASEHELDDLDCWSLADGTHREIARVVISRNYAGQGLAGQMLSLLLEELRNSGCRGVHLAVACQNRAAIRTYEKLGFAFLRECQLFGHDFFLCEKTL